QTIERRVQRPAGHLSTGLRVDLLEDRDGVRLVLQPQDGKEDDLFELSQIDRFGHDCNVGQIRGNGVSSSERRGASGEGRGTKSESQIRGTRSVGSRTSNLPFAAPSPPSTNFIVLAIACTLSRTRNRLPLHNCAICDSVYPRRTSSSVTLKVSSAPFPPSPPPPPSKSDEMPT